MDLHIIVETVDRRDLMIRIDNSHAPHYLVGPKDFPSRLANTSSAPIDAIISLLPTCAFWKHEYYSHWTKSRPDSVLFTYKTLGAYSTSYIELFSKSCNIREFVLSEISNSAPRRCRMRSLHLSDDGNKSLRRY